MKFYETHFEEYLLSNQKVNLHPKLEKVFENFPKRLTDFKNIIFYGPSGVGKYTQMLRSIKMYSPSELKYEKKISVSFNKQQYYFKISDVHYEVDMSLLGCNSKLLWHDIYLQIVDIISAKNEKSGIIVCKYFHETNSELLDNFYSYMQNNTTNFIDLKFILISEKISFIPDNILNSCEVVNICRPSKKNYNNCIKQKLHKNETLSNISNIKNLQFDNYLQLVNYKIICDKIIDSMKNIKELKFLKFRDLLYDILIYNLDITDCVWYILYSFIKENKIKKENLSNVLVKTYSFYQYYNNNYRPIFHIESYFFYLIKVIHNY